MIVVFDVETTGLPKRGNAPLTIQPSIVEFAAVCYDVDGTSLTETRRLSFLCKPPTPMDKDVIKIHGITNEMVHDEHPFAHHYRSVCKLFLGCSTIVAHNVEFDCTLLLYELQRLGKEYYFPWPPNRLCTVEATKSIQGKRMRLEDMYHHFTGRKRDEHYNGHRALDDVLCLADCLPFIIPNKGKSNGTNN